MIEVNERENHSKEKKILKERDRPDMAAAFPHIELSGPIFWSLAQQWPIKASSGLCPAVLHHHVVSWAECGHSVVDYRPLMLIFVLKFKIQRNLSIWEILPSCITGYKPPNQ